jgi:two-component system sensor histidine kinase RegB
MLISSGTIDKSGLQLQQATDPESREAIQLRWLVLIRWVVLASLFAIFFGANHFLDLELPTAKLYGVLGILVVSNILLAFVTNPSEVRYAVSARGALLIDVLGLAALLYFCGGYTNPFSMMFLAYVTLAAVVLDARWTWIVFAASLCCFFGLFFFHVPLPQLGMHGDHGHHMHQEGFSLHLHGMLVAFVLIGVVIASFVTRMSREIAEQAAKIAELRRVEDERRRLVSLATLTAGAAHELATPLATLSLIGDDLCEVLGVDPRWREDIEIMQSELRRCSGILQRMRSGGVELDGEAPQEFGLQDVLTALEREFSSQNRGVGITFQGELPDDARMYSLQQALSSSLRALLTNAVQACAGIGSVLCRTEVSDRDVIFRIQDSGEGMSPETADRAGEPFFTSKAPGEGMGLGLYLTRLFALQVGGALTISSALGKGTTVILRVPRTIEV